MPCTGGTDLSPRSTHIAYLCVKSVDTGQAAHTHVHEIVRGLRRRGWRVHLFAPGLRRKSRAFASLRRIWSFVDPQIRLWLRRPRFDIVYVRAHFPTVLTVLWGRLHGIPVILENNGLFEDVFVVCPWLRPLRWLFWGIVRLQMALGSAVVTDSKGRLDLLKRRFRARRGSVVPNAANPQVFRPAAR